MWLLAAMRPLAVRERAFHKVVRYVASQFWRHVSWALILWWIWIWLSIIGVTVTIFFSNPHENVRVSTWLGLYQKVVFNRCALLIESQHATLRMCSFSRGVVILIVNFVFFSFTSYDRANLAHSNVVYACVIDGLWLNSFAWHFLRNVCIQSTLTVFLL